MVLVGVISLSEIDRDKFKEYLPNHFNLKLKSTFILYDFHGLMNLALTEL